MENSLANQIIDIEECEVVGYRCAGLLWRWNSIVGGINRTINSGSYKSIFSVTSWCGYGMMLTRAVRMMTALNCQSNRSDSSKVGVCDFNSSRGRMST